MFNNLYLFAEEPLPFHWNDEVYNTIDEWRADTGLDANSQFFIGPLPSRAQTDTRSGSMRSSGNRPCDRMMFRSLHRLAESCANEGLGAAARDVLAGSAAGDRLRGWPATTG